MRGLGIVMREDSGCGGVCFFFTQRTQRSHERKGRQLKNGIGGARSESCFSAHYAIKNDSAQLANGRVIATQVFYHSEHAYSVDLL